MSGNSRFPSQVFFNLKVFRKDVDKEFKVVNVPLDNIDDVVREIKKKYG